MGKKPYKKRLERDLDFSMVLMLMVGVGFIVWAILFLLGVV